MPLHVVEHPSVRREHDVMAEIASITHQVEAVPDL
jgi:hypothetical protein